MKFDIWTEKINCIQFLNLMEENKKIDINVIANVRVKSEKKSDIDYKIYIEYKIKSINEPFRLDWDIVIYIKFDNPIENFDVNKVLTDYDVSTELDEMISKFGHSILSINLPYFSDIYKKQNYDKGD